MEQGFCYSLGPCDSHLHFTDGKTKPGSGYFPTTPCCSVPYRTLIHYHPAMSVSSIKGP